MEKFKNTETIKTLADKSEILYPQYLFSLAFIILLHLIT